MANLLFAARESDSLRSENPGMSQPSRGLVLAVTGIDEGGLPSAVAALHPHGAALKSSTVFDGGNPTCAGGGRPRRGTISAVAQGFSAARVRHASPRASPE